jgi:hypothetical protein
MIQAPFSCKNRSRMLVLFVLSLLVAGGFQSARAQDWVQLPSVNIQTRGLIPYFVNSNIGFYFNNEAIGGLRRTTDGGTSWTLIPFFDSLVAFIAQIEFVDKSHGYIACYASDSTRGGVFETNDQGDHWRRITPVGRTTDGVNAAQNDVFVSSPAWDGVYEPLDNIIFTSDDGVTWDSITSVQGLTLDQGPHFEWIYGNRGNFVASIYYKNLKIPKNIGMPWGDTYIVYSTDLGLHWSASLLDSNYVWWGGVSVLVVPHTCQVFRQFLDSQDILSQINDNGTAPDTYSFLSGLTPFTSWDSSFMHHETGNWLAGNACAIYSLNAWAANPNYEYSDTSMYRSTDTGATWTVIQADSSGPSFTEVDDYYHLSQASVVGYGAVVFVGDYYGHLWKTTDGGDGSLSVSALAPQFALSHSTFMDSTDTLVVNECSPPSMQVYNQNIGCSYGTFDSISIVGLNPTEYSVVSTHYCTCQQMPDTSFVTLMPATTGLRVVTIHYHFTDDEFNQIDTSIQVTLIVNPSGGSVPLSLYFKPSSINIAAGDTLEIPVYLSGNTTLDTTSITLPFGIDTNVLRPIGFQSAVPGLSNDTIIFSNGTVNVLLQADSILLNGETLIGYLRCIVYLADTLATTVTLSGASLTSVNAPCVALSLTTDSVNILINGCGDKTLLQFMKTGQIPMEIQSIVPNPSTDAIQINFINPTSSAISYQVLDALGQTHLSGVTGENALSLDVSSLPQGVYFFRATNANGFSVSSKLAIVR